MKTLKWMLLLIILAVAGCDMVQKEDGRIVHKSQVAPNEAVIPLSPADVVEKVIHDITPIAQLMPYGSAVAAMLLTGVGFYRKYKPQAKALQELVSAVETMPEELQSQFKNNMSRVLVSETKRVIKKVKS